MIKANILFLMLFPDVCKIKIFSPRMTITLLIVGSRREKTCLRRFGNNRRRPSAPLLFTVWKAPYHSLLHAKFCFLASLCSCGDWFESHFVGDPKDRFSHDEAQL